MGFNILLFEFKIHITNSRFKYLKNAGKMLKLLRSSKTRKSGFFSSRIYRKKRGKCENRKKKKARAKTPLLLQY